MTHTEYLEAARALIADEKNWTTGVYARNEKEEEVSWESPEATKFCAAGAINRVLGNLNYAVDDFEYKADTYDFLQKAIEEFYLTGNPGLTIVNDDEDHAFIMAIYDRAIELSRRQS